MSSRKHIRQASANGGRDCTDVVTPAREHVVNPGALALAHFDHGAQRRLEQLLCVGGKRLGVQLGFRDHPGPTQDVEGGRRGGVGQTILYFCDPCTEQFDHVGVKLQLILLVEGTVEVQRTIDLASAQL